MNWIISLWLALQSTPAEAEALRTSAPTCLTLWSATQHLGAARVAGGHFDVDVATILAIAHHESRFIIDTQTQEPTDSGGSRVSCGVMTPMPKRHCDDLELTLLGGYLAGAAHLRQWMDICHSTDHWKHDVDDMEILRCARRCSRHRNLPGCGAVQQFEERSKSWRTVQQATVLR
jgi:hypothetical protein